MSCSSCSGNKSLASIQRIPAESIKPSSGSILQFLADNGWYAVGTCACSPPMTIHQNDKYKDDVVIWANASKMDIRRLIRVMGKDSRSERVAGVANYEHVYRTYFQL